MIEKRSLTNRFWDNENLVLLLIAFIFLVGGVCGTLVLIATNIL